MKHTKTREVIRMGCSALLMLAICATAMAQEPAAGSAAHLGEDAIKTEVRDPAAVAQSSRSAARDLDGTNATTPTGSRTADPALGANATTHAVLLANCPKSMSETDWLKLMANPVNASLYSLRITQAMLDTLDASQLDLQYQYQLVREL